MANISTIDACKLDLFTAKEELVKRYDAARVDHIIRLREMYEWMLANPDKKDKMFIAQFEAKYHLSRGRLYEDLGYIKTLLPMLSSATRDFHRFRANEMLLETYAMAKLRKDFKTMEKAAADYAKINRVDIEDEQAVPYDDIVFQPFTATEDPSILGLKRMDEKTKRALYKSIGEKYPEVEDIEYEPADIEEDELFKEENPDESTED